MTGTIVIVPPGWETDHASAGFVRHVRPFGRLIVSPGPVDGAGQPTRWSATWVHGSDPAWLVAGPFDKAEDAFAAAVRWLFDSWTAIEAQLEPETFYRRDPVLNLIVGSFIALLIGVLGGIALAELL